jgi:hypothetical protein
LLQALLICKTIYMTQETAIETIKTMPHDFNIDELIGRLIIIEKLDEAEKDFQEGRTFTHSQVQKMFEEWKK